MIFNTSVISGQRVVMFQSQQLGPSDQRALSRLTRRYAFVDRVKLGII